MRADRQGVGVTPFVSKINLELTVPVNHEINAPGVTCINAY